MTRPGNTAGVSLSDCFYQVCAINAEPLQKATGAGLRAQYFVKAPPPHLGLFARPIVSRLEPLDKPCAFAFSDGKGSTADKEGQEKMLGGDGVLGLPPDKAFAAGFASY